MRPAKLTPGEKTQDLSDVAWFLRHGDRGAVDEGSPASMGSKSNLFHAAGRMMRLGWLGLSGALVSAACIALLAAVDPKRRGRSPARPGLRRLLTLATFAPGRALGIAGRWSDFLIWVGAAAIFGWAIAALANRRPKSRPGQP